MTPEEKIKAALLTLGAVGAIATGAVIGVNQDNQQKVVLDEQQPTPDPDAVIVTVGQDAFYVAPEDFDAIKGNLHQDYIDNHNKVNVMDMFGQGTKLFGSVLDAEVKDRGGVGWKNVKLDTKDADGLIMDLLK